MYSLVYSCLPQVAAWATEALFKYGGEPHFVFPTTLGPANQAIGGSPAHFQAPPGHLPGGQYAGTPTTAQVVPTRQFLLCGDEYGSSYFIVEPISCLGIRMWTYVV